MADLTRDELDATATTEDGHQKHDEKTDLKKTVQKEIPSSNETGSAVIKVSKSHVDLEKYTVNSGIAVVINNIEFVVSGLNLPDRKGSDVDASSLYQRFQELGFESDLLGDATLKDIKEKFDEIKKDKKNLKKADCLAVVLLTHGDNDNIYATDGPMKINNLMNEFNAENCPELIMKPKIFTFQACRGGGIGTGVNVRVIRDQNVKVNNDPNQPDSVAEYKEYDENFGETIRIPNEADFLAVYATSSGYGAFRNSEKGSPFVSYLSEELINMKKGEDFYRVLTRVNRKVGTGYKPNYPKKDNITQMPCFISHLTKDLVLKQK